MPHVSGPTRALLLSATLALLTTNAPTLADDMPDDPSMPVYAAAAWPKTIANEEQYRERRTNEPTVSCLPDQLRKRLSQIEARWGKVEIISTHRPGARVRGTGRPSRHASCQAVDFRPPNGTYRSVANWLTAEHGGGVGTYRSGHIHIDVGPRYRWANR